MISMLTIMAAHRAMDRTSIAQREVAPRDLRKHQEDAGPVETIIAAAAVPVVEAVAPAAVPVAGDDAKTQSKTWRAASRMRPAFLLP